MEFYETFEFSKKKWSRINDLKRKQTKMFKIRELKLKEGGQAVKNIEFCNEVEPASKDYNNNALLMSRASELHKSQTVARLPIQFQQKDQVLSPSQNQSLKDIPSTVASKSTVADAQANTATAQEDSRTYTDEFSVQPLSKKEIEVRAREIHKVMKQDEATSEKDRSIKHFFKG